MLRFIPQIILAASLSLTFSISQASPTHESSPSSSMLKHAILSVINIKTYGTLPPNSVLDKDEEDNAGIKKSTPKHFAAEGSGIIISAKKGYIVTNAHVIKDAEKIIVTLKDGQQYAAEKIGVDEPSDIALLKIKAENLTDIPIANSNALEIGDKIYTIGDPFGLGTSVTSGIVSALDRGNLDLNTYENFIQIDAPINPGNSGGALINTQGEIVGMNTAILTESGGNLGIGFAIPSNMLTAVIPQLIQYGKVDRGVMGIYAQNFSTTLSHAMHLPDQEGAIVTEVMPFSPAEKAGICVGDIITHINGTAIHTASQLVNTVGFLRTGTEVKLTLIRDKKSLEASITIMNADKQKALSQKETPYFNDVSLQNFSFSSSENGQVNGVIIVDVDVDSAAWVAGLRHGDVILSANGEATTTVKELQQVISKAKETLTLRILRDHGAAFIVLTPESIENV